MYEAYEVFQGEKIMTEVVEVVNRVHSRIHAATDFLKWENVHSVEGDVSRTVRTRHYRKSKKIVTLNIHILDYGTKK